MRAGHRNRMDLEKGEKSNGSERSVERVCVRMCKREKLRKCRRRGEKLLLTAALRGSIGLYYSGDLRGSGNWYFRERNKS